MATGKVFCGDMEVTETVYHWAFFFVVAEELREKGLIAGGPGVDLEAMKAIKFVGKQAGFSDPDKDQLQAMTRYLMAGGEWEQESEPKEPTP